MSRTPVNTLNYPSLIHRILEEHGDSLDKLDGGAPEYPSAPTEVTVYARTTGSDETGDGTLDTPYRTFQRAIRDVPHVIPPGYIYTVDITDLGTEELPLNYAFPAITAPDTSFEPVEFGGPTPTPFAFGASFNIRAFPQPASNIPLADTSVLAVEIISVTQDPVSKLLTIEVQREGAPIASWAADALEGKFLIVEGFGFFSAVIHGSENIGPSSFVYAAVDFDVHTGSNLTIMEPSAVLKGQSDGNTGAGAISVMNCPQVAFQGIGFSADVDVRPLTVYGGPMQIFSLCDIGGLSASAAGYLTVFAGCVIRSDFQAAGGSYWITFSLIVDAAIGIFGGHGFTYVSSCSKRCSPLGTANLGTQGGSYPTAGWEIIDCLFKDTTLHMPPIPQGAIVGHGGGSFSLLNVLIEDSASSGVLMEGCGTNAFMENVGGTGNAEFGVRVNGGAYVRVLDDATDITGTGGDMRVGTLPPRTWADFRTGAPIANEFDIVAPAVGDTLVGGPILTVSNAEPIAVTTTNPHGLFSGDKVKVIDASPNTAAEGYWIVTVTGANAFTLNESDGADSGTYVAGGTVQTADGGTSGSRLFQRP